MRIDENGNVGIGTTTPDKKLDLTVSTSDDGLILQTSTGRKALEFLVDNGINGRGIINFYTSTSLLYGRINANTEGLVIDTIANRHMIFNKAGVEVMRISTAGNVGIGTTNPSSILDINGGSANGVNIQAANTGTEYVFNAKTSNGTSRLWVGGAGNVGIGNTAPEAKLEIKKGSSGLTSVNSQADALFLQNSSSTGITIATPDANKSSIFFSSASRQIGARINWGYNDLLMTLGTATANASLALKSGNESEAVRILSNGNVGIGTTNPSAKLEVAGSVGNFKTTGHQIFLTRNANNEIYAVGASSVLALGQNSAEKMRIHSNGNVGIGTNSPDRPLSVVGGNSMVARFQSTNTTAFIQFSNTVSTADQVRIGSNGTNLVLSTNYAERMRITPTGNVGIGTTSPGEKLEVDGQVLSDGYRLAAMQTAPAARNSTGTLGEIVIDGNHIYVCYATDSWSRVALDTSW